MNEMHPKTEGILESSLYVDDVAGAAQFYEKIFGFRIISDFGWRGCAMQASNRQVLLLFKKGGSRTIQSPHDGDGELHLAFAISIHKSQGSEYPAVVIPVHTQHFVMLQRNLLYTGITRGRKLVVLVGSRKAVRLAVYKAETSRRFSLLKWRLKAGS